MDAYIYQPLLEGQIRLLRISDGPDQFKIIHTHFDTAPAYSVVSYSWNDQFCDQDLRIDRCYLKVIKNLISGLPHLIECANTQYLWIDAICINQRDDDEKAIQVPLMKEIYTKCQECLVWLGQCTPESELAIDAIPRMAKHFSLLDSPEVWMMEGIAVSSGNVLSSPLWRGFTDLFSRPWFKRVWTFQEAVLPAVVTFLCGSRSVAYDDMKSVVVPLLDHLTTLELFYPRSDFEDPFLFIGFLKLIRVAKFRASSQLPRTPSDSLKLLYTTGPWHATHRLDKIYGVLGLVDHSLQKHLVVDYHKTQVQVSTELAKWYCSQANDLFLLNLASSGRKKRLLPSWIPNFAKIGGHWCRGAIWNRFKAGVERIPTSQPTPIVTNDELQLSGFCIDRVEAVASRIVGSTDDDDGRNKCLRTLSWEQSCLALSKKVFGVVGDEVPNLHWRTMLSTVWNHDDEPPTESDYHHLKGLLVAVASSNNVSSMSEIQNQTLATQIRRLSQIEKRGEFFSTVGGRVGLGPIGIQPGDQICILYNGLTPFILRPRPTTELKYRLVGDAYIHGLMHGEAFDADTRGPDERFVLT
ncbi:hypothetical protein G7Y89_g5939 [Cudoniella acicularis]|uniref:Heterokaryon incompatibility domain-containing protein n=1 Tax=Cudoniella acicularis TaxID=354080 RepID=A0A8H4RLH0_9HELO|nr:hypothetical protein G7Y89_g5939 [Cudoniella acicularis]